MLPKNFGNKGEPDPDWQCLCGHVNPGRQKLKRANRVVCWMCGVDQDTVTKAREVE